MPKILIDEAVVRQAIKGLERSESALHKARAELNQALADAALDKKADNAKELGLDYVQMTKPYRLLPDNGSKYFGESWDKIEKPAQPDHMEDVLAMVPPPECKTEAEKTAFAFGWFKALESVREQPAPAQEPDPDELTIAYMSGVHEGKKRKPWVGLTDDERRHLRKCNQQHDAFALAVEALLKEKNQ
jgi:hypothetical protein